MMKKFIEDNLGNIKNDLKELVSYKSVLCDDELPFGSENRKVLDASLKIMDRLGFKTKNLDYYCGYGEVGQGDKLVGIAAHLDVVPVSDGWNSDPFALTEKDGKLYGRGVSDDKGAAICSMYALKYLLDTGYTFKKRFRLLLGCNEETGSKCMDYYTEHDEPFSMGFTPDAEFPGIYAEKGVFGCDLVGKSKIKNIKGGDASNVVCNKVEASISSSDYNQDKFKEFLDKNNIKYEINGDDVIVYGKSSHASIPQDGINAINYLFDALNYAGFDDAYTKNISKYFSLTTDGSLIGLDKFNDDISVTTTNLGVISEKDGVITCTLDIRFPVKCNPDEFINTLMKISNSEFSLEGISTAKPLYYDKNTNWIQALKKAYVSVTNDTSHDLQAIGGGTYAKHLNNIIAFGCQFLDENNHIHESNEELSVESLKKQILIYIETIKNLNEVE